MYKSFFKRVIDVLFSSILIILLSPFLLISALAIKMSMGSPVLFTQKRVGKNLKPFVIYKFRTMNEKRGENGIDNSDGARLTKLGSILRKLSIDEFPQLFNILKGDMSFIGPRPLLEKYVPYYNKREIRRHEVRPGMTSLAGVNGRSYLTWEEQFEYDVKYVDNLLFKTDLSIFLQTIPKVLGSKDMMVVGRKNKESFDIYRKNQLQSQK